MSPQGLVLVGASTGGVQALMTMLPRLPATLRASVVVVLHLPPDKPSLLVDLFAPLCALPVREPDDKEALVAGTIYIAPPNYHLMVESDEGGGAHFALSVDEAVNFSRPAIDVLFDSAAAALSRLPMVGVLLSGASRDGMRGAQALALVGAQIWVQDPDSAQARLMPAAAQEVPGSLTMTLEQMAPALGRMFGPQDATTSKEPR